MELCLEVIFDFSEVVNERRRMEMEARKRIIFPVDVPTAEEAHKYIILFNGLIGVVKLGFEIIAHAFLTGAQIFKMVLEETDLDVMFDIKGDDIPQTIAGLAKQVALYGQNRIFGFTIHCNAGRKAIQDAVQAVKDNFKGPNPPMVIVVTLLTSLNESDFEDLDIKA
ncbi:MAG: orotidine 5'-phosphate decarboxylase, partial [Candidatus Portnoybacteria bacterium]|nr:orotidine 5'-phosphate decarboxylase [Candidatus Portnoybacteria bacterium]